MPDIVVTVPKSFGLETWREEGDGAGEPWSGELYAFTTGGARPMIRRGERVYVVYNGRLRGFAPLVELRSAGRQHALIRGGGAVAVTIDRLIVGFRGWRYRDWEYAEEQPFPTWWKP
jgi:hypothetical protein